MPCKVSLDRVLVLANPVENWPWRSSKQLTTQQLRAAVGKAKPRSLPINMVRDGARWSMPTCRDHVERIRFFMDRGCSDAILIDVGCPALGYGMPRWPVLDGNHRLAAAILRGDADILVDVQGQISYAAELFIVDEEDLVNEEFPEERELA